MTGERLLDDAIADRWYLSHTFGPGDVPGPHALAAAKGTTTIAVVIPALNEARTIGSICEVIDRDLVSRAGLVDELLVIDGGSTDGTGALASAAGAHVLDAASVLPSIPFAGGKGESLWRSLAATDADIVCWVDADIRNFHPRFVTRLVGPLLLDPQLAFVKAFYRRPIEVNGVLAPEGGGRVTELLARPLLNAFFPELSGFAQPLAGEYAGRRDVLRRLPFFTGYSVEAGLLIDLLGTVGLDAMAQSDLEERVHRNRPLTDLGPMAHAIGRSILSRAHAWGRVRMEHEHTRFPRVRPTRRGLEPSPVRETERPPLASLRRGLAPITAI